ncbi:hypothetical protein [Burkholderia oklahomensis]|uniref:hypothetical protein n=1 Tax=Burkholderia oklahomensis TaxID=342113 RepID=UPI000F53B62B|nr:hypothetical protein [Burkholderia oklahomensis]MBI0362380.1 hypothetical protein [Burkholderia oklahomensis]
MQLIKARRAKDSASRDAEKRYHAPFIQYIFLTHSYDDRSARHRAADHRTSTRRSTANEERRDAARAAFPGNLR